MKAGIIAVLVVFLLGFSDKLKAQYDDSLGVYLMDLSLEELLSIKVVTAGKRIEKITEVPASMVVISKTEIERYGFQSVEDLLQHITGLFMTDDYNWLGTTNYGVRGFYSSGPFNNIILLVNGVNQMEEFTRGTPLSKLGVVIEAIDRIEVVRGPMSVLYGSGAFFGAINIITNTNETNEVVLQVGQNNTQKVNMVFSKFTDEIKFNFSGGYNYTNGLDIPYTQLTTNPIKPNGNTYLENNGLTNDARTTGQLSDLRKHTNLSVVTDNFNFDLSMNSTNAGMMDGQPTLGEGSYFIANSALAHINYRKTFTAKTSIHIKETFSYYNYYNNYEQDYLSTNMHSYQYSSFYETEANLLYSPNQKADIIFGLYNRYIPDYRWGGDYSYWGYNFSNFLTQIDNPFAFNAVFLQTTLHLGKFNIVAGLRAEQVNKINLTRTNDYDTLVITRKYTYNYTDINIIPRLAVMYSFNKNNILKMFYGMAIKQPSLADIHPYCLFPNWQTLKPSTINTVEINYINTIANVVTTNFSLFYNHINNLITRIDIFDPLTGELNIESSNSGKMYSYGTELRLVIKPGPNLLVDLSGTYQHSIDLTPGMEEIPMAYSPEFLGYAKFFYLIKDKISIGSTIRYVGAMHSYYDNTYIDPLNTTLGKNGRIGVGSKAYIVSDANIRIDELWKGIYLNLKISKIFDTEIRYPTTTANAWMDKGALGWGRSFFVSAGIKF